MLDEKTRALLGDHEAAKRLTDTGVLIPCPGCGEEGIVIQSNQDRPWQVFCGCGFCAAYFESEYEARLAWNTRAPILSAEEMEILEGTE